MLIETEERKRVHSGHCGLLESMLRLEKIIFLIKLMHGLKSAGVEIDRKMLADLAVHDADAFKAISDKAKTALENA